MGELLSSDFSFNAFSLNKAVKTKTTADGGGVGGALLVAAGTELMTGAERAQAVPRLVGIPLSLLLSGCVSCAK